MDDLNFDFDLTKDEYASELLKQVVKMNSTMVALLTVQSRILAHLSQTDPEESERYWAGLVDYLAVKQFERLGIRKTLDKLNKGLDRTSNESESE